MLTRLGSLLSYGWARGRGLPRCLAFGGLEDMSDYEIWRWLFAACLTGFVGGYIANLNNRNPWIWGVVCFFTAGLGLIVLMILGKGAEPKPLPRVAWEVDLNAAPAPVPVRPERAWWNHLKEIAANGMVCRQTGKKVALMQLYAGRQINDHGYA